MPTVREEVRAVLREFGELPGPNPVAAEFYVKMALKAYADAIRLSPHRTPAHNTRAIEVACEFGEKAILFGASETLIEDFFFNIRRHWVPMLVRR